MAKTKVFDTTQLDQIYITLTHNPDGSATAKIGMAGKQVAQDGTMNKVEMEYAYANLASADKNQCANLVKFLSKLFNMVQVDENSETVGDLR